VVPLASVPPAEASCLVVCVAGRGSDAPNPACASHAYLVCYFPVGVVLRSLPDAQGANRTNAQTHVSSMSWGVLAQLAELICPCHVRCTLFGFRCSQGRLRNRWFDRGLVDFRDADPLSLPIPLPKTCFREAQPRPLRSLSALLSAPMPCFFDC